MNSIRIFYIRSNFRFNRYCGWSISYEPAIIDTLFIGSTLHDDKYTFTYFVIDSAGNTSTESGSNAIFVDATAPTAPNNPDLKAANDKGTSNDEI